MGTVGNIIVAGINIALSVDGTDCGFTQDGVSVDHKVTFMDLEADQSTGILGKKKVKETLQLKANLEEATLENLKIAMCEENSIASGGGWKRLSFGGGTTVAEHALIFTGVAPGTSKTRKLHINKAVAIDIGSMPYKKGDKTLIPVTFEAIIDTAQAAGDQYGYYEDQE
jgi:hypothetical protein